MMSLINQTPAWQALEQHRQEMQGAAMRDLFASDPGRAETMFTALQNVVPSHLMDSKLHDFKNLKTTGIPDENGDKAFDEDAFTVPTLPGLQVVPV